MLQQNTFTQSVSVISVLIISGLATGCATSNRANAPQVGDYRSQTGGNFSVASRTTAQRDAEPHRQRPEAPDTSGVLTLESCINIALDRNPMYLAARHGVTSREASVGVAQAPYYPEVSLSSVSVSYTHLTLPTKRIV